MTAPDHAFHWNVLFNLLAFLFLFGCATVTLMALITRRTTSADQQRRVEVRRAQAKLGL